MPSNEDKKPIFGTLYVDEKYLEKLHHDVDLNLLSRSTTTFNYLEMLTFLGRHGIDVVIPEMISFKTASVLKGGVCTQDYFIYNEARRKPQNIDLKRFFERVGRGEIPGVRIKSPDDSDPSAELINALHNIIDDHQVSIEAINKSSRFVPKAIEMTTFRRTSVNIATDVVRLSNPVLGADSIVHDFKKAASGKESSKSTVLLARNIDFYKDRGLSAEDLVKNRVFVYCLKELGIADAMGFNPSSSYTNIANDLFSTTPRDAVNNEPYDDSKIERIKQSPIYHMLSALAAELRQQKSQEVATEGVADIGQAEESPAVKRFRDREKRTKQLQAQRGSEK